ncbi:MAG: ATP-binding protein [Wujia sp.]
MRSSIRTKITLMVVAFSSFICITSWIICNYLISGIFIWNLKENLCTAFDSCNELFSNHDSDSVDAGDLYGNIKNPGDAVVLIFDSVHEKIYTTISDESQMMDSLSEMLESIRKASNKVNTYKPGSYVIKRNHDTLINADYYDLIGTLDNGYTIILRSPIARVEATMHVVNTVFIYIAVGLIIFGSIFILILSNFFSAPLKRLSHAARRMTELDFDVKVPVVTKDEIGELGTCMNEMSRKLECTISELKAANIELEKDIEKKKQIDEMRKEFLSHVSHELKTPIALIQGYAEGLKDNLFDDQESKEFYADVIIDEAHKMNSLVKKLLTLNEIEFGGNPLKIERFELVEFIDDIINASRILIDDSGATIEFKEKGPVYVWADEYMIEEVFTNYLTNAVHYVSQNGIIRVWFEHVDNNVRVCVYNSGSQIAPDDIDKLFIKFYKADKARTREYGGNGIGLSIVAATMEAHGKAYGVYNVEDGVVFYFELDANLTVEMDK